MSEPRGRIVFDKLGYPTFEDGGLVPASRLQAGAIGSLRLTLPHSSPQSQKSEDKTTTKAPPKKKNYVQENIRRAKETLKVKHKLPAKVRVRADLPADVFGTDYKTKEYKSKSQQSREATQKFMQTFREAVQDARQRGHPRSNTSRNVYAPHFKDIWFPVLEPRPAPTSPVHDSFKLSGGFSGGRRTSTRSQSAKVRSLDAAVLMQKAKMDTTDTGPARDWRRALDEGAAGLDAAAETSANARFAAILKHPTEHLYAFFDSIIRVGHNFTELKQALRARDSEKVGYVSWDDFVMILTSVRWQFRGSQLDIFKECLLATNIARAAGSDPSNGEIVDYINFVLSIRSWQTDREAQQVHAAVSGKVPSPTHGTTPAARSGQIRNGNKTARSPQSLSPSSNRRSRQRSPRRRRESRAVSITHESYELDPVLASMLRS